ncbi:MAG: hypothetical protein WAW69_06235 [Polaromonas sp.]
MANNNVPQGGLASGEKKQTGAQVAYNNLTKKLCQLEAMLAMSYGDARESLDEMNDSLRDHYYWACSDLARDCGNLLESIPYPSCGEVSHV